MSHKKRKHKAVHHIHQPTGKKKTASVINRHPKVFFTLSIFLALVAASLLSIGHISEAKVGSSMILLFFALVLGFLANSALPKKIVK
tara:strand:+ start:24914 stop:25174 length:261 start_codon:yes stop_codon:yes gene_type:complete